MKKYIRHLNTLYMDLLESIIESADVNIIIMQYPEQKSIAIYYLLKYGCY
jgi:hypothetical protein